jgi:hypothetical protein
VRIVFWAGKPHPSRCPLSTWPHTSPAQHLEGLGFKLGDNGQQTGRLASFRFPSGFHLAPGSSGRLEDVNQVWAWHVYCLVAT